MSFDCRTGQLRLKNSRTAADAELSPPPVVGFKPNPSMNPAKQNLGNQFDAVADGLPTTQQEVPDTHNWKSPKGSANADITELGEPVTGSKEKPIYISSSESEFLSAEFKIATMLPLEVQQLIKDHLISLTIKKIVPNCAYIPSVHAFNDQWQFRGGCWWDCFGQRYIELEEAIDCWDQGYYPEYEKYPSYERQYPDLAHCIAAKYKMQKQIAYPAVDRLKKEDWKFVMNKAYRYSSCSFNHRGLMSYAVGEQVLWACDLHMIQYDPQWTIQWCPFLSFIGLGNWAGKALNPACNWDESEMAIWEWLDACGYSHWRTFAAHSGMYYQMSESDTSSSEDGDVPVMSSDDDENIVSWGIRHFVDALY